MKTKDTSYKGFLEYWKSIQKMNPQEVLKLMCWKIYKIENPKVKNVGSKSTPISGNKSKVHSVVPKRNSGKSKKAIGSKAKPKRG